jgi:hypothetical protein
MVEIMVPLPPFEPAFPHGIFSSHGYKVSTKIKRRYPLLEDIYRKSYIPFTLKAILEYHIYFCLKMVKSYILLTLRVIKTSYTPSALWGEISTIMIL